MRIRLSLFQLYSPKRILARFCHWNLNERRKKQQNDEGRSYVVCISFNETGMLWPVYIGRHFFWGMKNLYLRVREIQAKLETKQYIFQVIVHNYAKILWREKSMQNIFEWVWVLFRSLSLSVFFSFYLWLTPSLCLSSYFSMSISFSLYTYICVYHIDTATLFRQCQKFR